MPDDTRLTAAIKQQVKRMDDLSQRAGFGALAPEEIGYARQRVSDGVSQTLQAAQRSRGSGGTPFGRTTARIRDLTFRSNVPMARAVGRTRPVDRIPDQEVGFTGANPVIGDQGYLQAIRRRLRAGSSGGI